MQKSYDSAESLNSWNCGGFRTPHSPQSLSLFDIIFKLITTAKNYLLQFFSIFFIRLVYSNVEAGVETKEKDALQMHPIFSLKNNKITNKQSLVCLHKYTYTRIENVNDCRISREELTRCTNRINANFPATKTEVTAAANENWLLCTTGKCGLETCYDFTTNALKTPFELNER